MCLWIACSNVYRTGSPGDDVRHPRGDDDLWLWQSVFCPVRDHGVERIEEEAQIRGIVVCDVEDMATGSGLDTTDSGLVAADSGLNAVSSGLFAL